MKKILKQVSETVAAQMEAIEKRKKNIEAHHEKKKKKVRYRLLGHTQENHVDQIMEVQISTRTLIKVMIAVSLFFLLGEVVVELKNVLTMTFISFLMALGLSPILDNIERYRIPRPIAILILYVIFLGGLAIVFIKVLPIIAEQLFGIAADIKNLFDGEASFQIPNWIAQLLGDNLPTTNIQNLLADNLVEVSKNIKDIAGSTFNLVSGIFQGLFNLSFTLILLFFILLEREQIGHFILALFPHKDREYILSKTVTIQKKLNRWFRGQGILMLSIGFGMFIGMKIFEFLFGMKYAVTVAIFAGFMELFPYIGVVLSYILVGAIALNASPLAFVVAISWVLFMQLLEGNVLVPLVMEKAVGLSSAMVLVTLVIGATLGFALGGTSLAIICMIFSVPIAASISIFVQEYADRDK
jgi:predicted PurR-regulated permease PerM